MSEPWRVMLLRSRYLEGKSLPVGRRGIVVAGDGLHVVFLFCCDISKCCFALVVWGLWESPDDRANFALFVGKCPSVSS